MEAEVDRHPRQRAGVGERAVHALPVGDRHVAGRAHERHRLGQPVRAGGVDHRRDVDLAAAVRAGDDPQPVGRRAAVQLRHEVEAVGAAVEVGAVPVRPTVLVPGDRSAEARLLDPDRLVERHEVVAVHRRRDGEQERVAVQAQARGRELQRRVDELHDPLRRLRRRRGLVHLRRVATVGRARSRPTGPTAGGPTGCPARGRRTRAPGRPWRSSAGALRDRRPVEQVDDVALDVVELLRSDARP